MLSFLTSLVYFFATLAAFLVALRFWILPLLLGTLTKFRVNALSPFSCTGIEWRPSPNDVVPIFRLERARWQWGGCKSDSTGWLILRIDGVSFRVKAGNKDDAPTPRPAKSSRRVAAYRNRAISNILSLIMHHYPAIARVLSIQICDVRIIFDDLDGLELTVKELRFGVKVEFEGDEPGIQYPISPNSPATNHAEFQRVDPFALSPDHSPISSPMLESPLNPNTGPFSPGAPSPGSSPYQAFVFPPSEPKPEPQPAASRLSHARRRASVMSSRMTSTATQIWSRAIGRAHGSVTVTTAIHDVAVILPHLSPRHPIANRPSIPDLRPQPHPQCKPKTNGINHRQSSKSLKETEAESVRLTYSMDRLFRSVPRYAIPNNEGGYERLLALEGQSVATFLLGFGPKKGLLGEDTLKSNLEMGKLHTTLGAWDKVQELLKMHSKGEKSSTRPERQWRPQALPRIILRAFEAVSVSFTQVILSHFLPASTAATGSASSSSSDLSSAAGGVDCFTMSLEVIAPSLHLTAADSSNNDRARNAFGTNYNPESKVRGVGFELRWETVEFSCVLPGDSSEGKHQLVVLKQGELEGLSTWRPMGWTREELLFSSDPNLALIVGRSTIASADVTADLQLLDDLEAAWKAYHPAQQKGHAEPTSTSPALLPRIRIVLDVGHTMVVLADGGSSSITLTMATDGFHVGCYTSFWDIVARRRDKGTTKTAFREEEELEARRSEMGSETDYSMPDSMLKPQLRRNWQDPAALVDGFSLTMGIEGSISVEPLSLHMSLDGPTPQDQQTFHLASIGRAHGTVGGDVLGRAIHSGHCESAQLDRSSMSVALDLGIDNGVKINLWEPKVLKALVAMGEARRHGPILSRIPKTKADLLSRLPSGVSARISLGTVSAFVGRPDPNPNCDLHLIRGIWLQTTITVEYAHYANSAQTMKHRHALSSPSRTKLRLPEDATTRALALFHSLQATQGEAALISFTTMDAFVKPIFHGERFVQAGGTSMSHEGWRAPEAKEGDDFVGWDFRRPKKGAPGSGIFANNVPPLEISDTDQAQRPLVRIAQSNTNWTIQRETPNATVTHRISGKTAQVNLVGDLSHVYCALLASISIQNIADAWKKADAAIKQSSVAPSLTVELSIPAVSAHLAFPLREQLFISLGNVHLGHRPSEGLHGRVDQALVYVPSPNEIGSWEELARIKHIKLNQSLSDVVRAPIQVSADAMQVRIPVAYQLSRIILNVSVAIKSVKLLMRGLKSGELSTVLVAPAEGPKKVPPMEFRIKHVVLEAKDNPIETNLNLAWRAGLVEQEIRLSLEDLFERKMNILAEAEFIEGDEEDFPPGRDKTSPRLSTKAAVSLEEARYRLDWHKSCSWIKRIKLARSEQRRREDKALYDFRITGSDALPIKIAPVTRTAPLFRGEFQDLHVSVSDPGLSREEIIQFMGDLSAPFEPGVEFTLMVPLKLGLHFRSATCTLRDYPLPLVKIPPPDEAHKPAWSLDTTFIIAEERAGDDSIMFVPSCIVPEGCGAVGAQPLTFQIAKTIMPVKTYTRPHVKIASKRVTEFTWGNAYQPAIQDFMKVIESLSHPPRDPSPRVGFWDKFRLILHWRVTIDFTGPVHLHLKGAYDPYAITGFGAGFALAWHRNTQLTIGQPNPQYETIQISAGEMMVAIPDLSSLNDDAAIGSGSEGKSASQPDHANIDLIQRRFTKPCARFQNGVRVGFGFVFERTCRPHNCKACGGTDNLMHRQCRIFDFLNHQQVILRSPQALEREESRLGRPVDSYEGFRSDYVHFSVSLVSPTNEIQPDDHGDSDRHNSMHMNPKAFAHFFAWWKLFDHTMSLPIRQGKLFPDSPPASKKFGRSLGTIKYRFDLAPLYISHIYSQVSHGTLDANRSQSLGVKYRFRRFRADAHQRAQEKTVRHEKLQKTTIVTHKPFYAADLLLDNIDVIGIRAEFTELSHRISEHVNPLGVFDFPHASQLPPELAKWYNLLDFIDADRKPLDRDPKVEIESFGDCQQVFFSKRVKARQTTPQDEEDDGSSLGSTEDSRYEMESSKFGHEKSHICYLGAAPGVGPTQVEITKKRLEELHDMRRSLLDAPTESNVTIPKENRMRFRNEIKEIDNRIRILSDHIVDLQMKEKRHMDDDTFESGDIPHDQRNLTVREVPFEHVAHVHCPRLFVNNDSRNIGYQYWYSSRDRKREEYTTSHKSLRSIRDGIKERTDRAVKGLGQSPMFDHTGATQPQQDESPGSIASIVKEMGGNILEQLKNMLREKQGHGMFELSQEARTDAEELWRPSLGLPAECAVKPKNQFLVFKPQIALRSEVDKNAIVLLAVEEISFKGYQVLDEEAIDSVSAEVMYRNYAFVKGLQAFYPNEQSLARDRGRFGVPKGLDFVPLEIFLDVKSEATDYDRVVLKTDAALSFDKFNHLRVPRGLDWPDAVDEHGEPIKHLRIQMDHTTVTVPRVTLSATSDHYTALYNIIDDLIMYQDPSHRIRSERVDNFIFAFDRRERDPEQLLEDLHGLQRLIREMLHLAAGYDANIDQLTDEGRNELVNIRRDSNEAMEQLYTVFDAIAIAFNREDAQAALKSASRMDVRIGGVAWHMLRDDFTPLIKLDIEGVLFTHLSNKDGSAESSIAIADVYGLNSKADAIYPEILTRYEEKSSGRRGPKEPFIATSWSTLAPVGGISIVRHLGYKLYPVRINLEERVGHAVSDYMFSARKKRRQESVTSGTGTHTPLPEISENGGSHGLLSHPHTNRTASTIELPSLHRTRSTVSIASTANSVAPSRSGSNQGQDDAPTHQDKFTTVPRDDVAEMRRRASANRTFLDILFEATSIVLTYKGDDRKKRKGFSMPDVVDFRIKIPQLKYTNKVWGYEDIYEHVKRDIKNFAWSQRGDLVSQIFKKTSVFRSKKGLVQLASHTPNGDNLRTKGLITSPSRLRYTFDPPPPPDEPATDSNLGRPVTRSTDSSTSPLSRVVSRLSLAGPHGKEHPSNSPKVHRRASSDPPDSLPIEELDSDHEESGGAVARGVKGLFGKLKKAGHRDDRDGSSSLNGSREDLGRTTSRNERSRQSTPRLN